MAIIQAIKVHGDQPRIDLGAIRLTGGGGLAGSPGADIRP